MKVNVVTDTKWVHDLKSSNPRRGFNYYDRVLTFEEVVEHKYVKDNFPGLGQETFYKSDDGIQWVIRTYVDSSD